MDTLTLAPSNSVQTSTDARPKLDALTGLRFFAALAVVFYHYSRDGFASAPVWILNLFSSGFIAVNLFFILSGFILAYTYLPARALDKRKFYLARFARIYPVYFQGLLLYAPFLIGIYLGSYPLPEALHRFAVVVPTSIGLVQAWIPWAAIEWNGPGWSLSVEAFLYLTFPFLAPVIWRWSERRAALVLAILWVLSVLPAVLFLWLDPHPHGWPWKHQDTCDWNSALTYTPLLRLPEFLAGVALCRVFLEKRMDRRTSAWIGGSALAAITAALSFRGSLSYEMVSNGLLDPLLAAMVFGLAAMPGLPQLNLLGEASYSLYILHVPAWLWITSLNEKTIGVNPNTAVFFVFYVAATIGLSIFSLRTIEAPYRDAIRRGLPLTQRKRVTA